MKNKKNTTCVQYIVYSGVIALHNCPGQYVTWARHPASLSYVSAEAGLGTTASVETGHSGHSAPESAETSATVGEVFGCSSAWQERWGILTS